MTHTASSAAHEVSDHPALETLARAGYAVNGLLHLVIAWIAIRVAMGLGGEADQGGALEAVRDAPAGEVLLWVGVLGYAGLALWQVLEAALGFHPGASTETLADRAKDLGKGVVYGALAWTTYQFATGGSSDSGETTSDVTASLMGAPMGQALVFALGLAVIGVGGYHVWKGATQKFLEDLRGNAGGDLGRAVVLAGTAGYIAKGVALGVVGFLFCVAAWTTDPEEATGLDGALKAMSGNPVGTTLLVVIAIGFVAYGLYSFARARYARL
jgi:hypothetical protein